MRMFSHFLILILGLVLPVFAILKKKNPSWTAETRFSSPKKNMEYERTQVLSLDGGGMKGLYSAELLAQIESDYGIRVDEHFDLIVGTSTGALIACGLALGHRPRELVQFYREKGKILFPNSPWKRIPHFFRSKHNPEPLRLALHEVFGDNRLGDCQRRLVIPTYSHDRDIPRLFKTPHHPRFKRDFRFPVRNVAMASAAAPTYFPAVEAIDNGVLIDGGVWANNPVMIGLVEAITVLGGRIEDIAILSIGTSQIVRTFKEVHLKGGFLHWGKEAVRVCMRGQSVCATNQAKLLLGNERFMRIDPIVAENELEMDGTDLQPLLSLAARDSLHRGKEIVDRFMHHQALPFEPAVSSSDISPKSLNPLIKNKSRI